MAPFVEMAQTDRPVKRKMEKAQRYRPSDCQKPAEPTTKPTRKKMATLHMDRHTGSKTPGIVRRDLCTVLTREMYRIYRYYTKFKQIKDLFVMRNKPSSMALFLRSW